VARSAMQSWFPSQGESWIAGDSRVGCWILVVMPGLEE
jgi:hypothetical protein